VAAVSLARNLPAKPVGSAFWQQLIKNKVRIDKLGKSPWKVSYADFYGTEANGEYKWVKVPDTTTTDSA